MSKQISCPVCENENAELVAEQGGSLNSGNDNLFHKINCPQCGEFILTSRVVNMINDGKIKRHLLSGYIRNQNVNGKKWTTENAIKSTDDTIKNLPEIPLAEKAELLLKALAADAEHYDTQFTIKANVKYIAKIAAKNEAELVYVTNMLLEEKHVKTTTERIGSLNISITPKGWNKVEALSKKTNFKQGFVAMWFHDDMKIIYDEAIKPAIEFDLQGVSTSLKAMRIDEKDHVNKIDDEIIAEIRRSRFVVADFTGHRGGVYFEAGFALGLGIPVIWTCKECSVNDLHFDIRQYNTILWKETDLPKLRKQLYERIRAVIY